VAKAGEVCGKCHASADEEGGGQGTRCGGEETAASQVRKAVTPSPAMKSGRSSKLDDLAAGIISGKPDIG